MQDYTDHTDVWYYWQLFKGRYYKVFLYDAPTLGSDKWKFDSRAGLMLLFPVTDEQQPDERLFLEMASDGSAEL